MAEETPSKSQKLSAITHIIFSKVSPDLVSPVTITPPTEDTERDYVLRCMMIKSMRGKDRVTSVHYIKCYKTIEDLYINKKQSEEAFRMARNMLLPDPNIPLYWKAYFNLLLAQADIISPDREHACNAAQKCFIEMMAVDGSYTAIPQTFEELQGSFLTHVKTAQKAVYREYLVKGSAFMQKQKRERDSVMAER